MVKFSPVQYAKSHVPPPGHQRTYILGYSIGMMANGIFLPIYVLYCVRVIGIPHAQTGLAIAIGGLVGLPLTMFAGDLADRLGPRRVVLFGLVGLLGGMGSYVFIQGFWSLLTVVLCMNIFAYTYLASEGALMRRIGGDGIVTFRNQVQTLGNIGVAVGALTAGIGLSIDTPWAYRSLFLFAAAAYLLVIIITLRIPDYEPLPKPQNSEGKKVPRWIVLRDRPFIAYALVAGGLTMSALVDDLLLPVWIVIYTDAPHWTVAMVFVVNTTISILFQMRLSRNVKTPRKGGMALLRCGITLLVAYLILASMPDQSPWLATVLVAIGAILVAVAQIWLVAGKFVLEFSLPPAHAQGQYDGFLNTMTTLSITVAPLVLLGVVASNGFIGWLGIAAFFLLLGLISPAVANWAARTRPQADSSDETTTTPDQETESGETASTAASSGMDGDR